MTGGDFRFKAKISPVALQGHVTEAFALVAMHENMDETAGRYLRQYVLAYDSANVKPEHVVDMIQRKIVETAEEMDLSATPLSAASTDHALRGAEIKDRKEHKAVVGVRETKNEKSIGTAFYSIIVLGGFVTKAVMDTRGGRDFSDVAEKVSGRVIDKLFGIEGMGDIFGLMRKGTPSYIM